jgi:hypothetical protein
MKKSLAGFLTLQIIALSGFFGAPHVQAAGDVGDTYNTHYSIEEFEDRILEIESGRIHLEQSVLFYKPGTTEPLYGERYTSESFLQPIKRAATTTYEVQGGYAQIKQYGERTMQFDVDVTQKKDYTYIRFNGAYNKKIANRWIRIPNTHLAAFNRATNHEIDMARAFVSDGDTAPTHAQEIDHELRTKHTLYAQVNEPHVEVYEGARVVRYDFEFNHKTFLKYFADLEAQLTKTEREDTLLGIPGFKQGLKNKKFVSAVIKDSYYSVWIDAKTGMPVRSIESVVIPAFGDRKEELEVLQETLFTELGTKQTIAAPTKYMEMEEALRYMKLKLPR